MRYENRAGESGPVPPRRDRFFHIGRDWFFHTREGADIGPFDNRAEAEQGLQDFIEFLQLADPTLLRNFYASLSSRQLS